MKKKIITIIIMITIIIIPTGIKASTISYDYSKYFIRYSYQPLPGAEQYWTSAIDLGTIFQTDNGGYINSVRTRFGITNKFQANTKYRVKINVKIGNDSNKNIYLVPNSIICQGSATSTWSSDENLISSCTFVARTFYNDNKNASYLFDIIPNTNIYGIQIAFYIKTSDYVKWYGDNLQTIRVLASSNITTDTSTSDTINNQTTEIIYNQNQNTEQIINNQNELLGNQCPNLLDNEHSSILNGWISGTTMRINSENGNRMIFLKVEPGETYTISREKLTSSFRVSSYNSKPGMTSSNVDYTVQNTNENNNGYIINYTPQYKYLIIHYANIGVDGQNLSDESLSKIMVVKGSTSKPYCAFGTYQSKLDEDHNYNTNPSENIDGSAIEQEQQAKDQLWNSLDFSGINNINISIDTETSSWIWQIVNNIRQMSSYIVLIITSVLGIGLIKMVLNR